MFFNLGVSFWELFLTVNILVKKGPEQKKSEGDTMHKKEEIF